MEKEQQLLERIFQVKDQQMKEELQAKLKEMTSLGDQFEQHQRELYMPQQKSKSSGIEWIV